MTIHIFYKQIYIQNVVSIKYLYILLFYNEYFKTINKYMYLWVFIINIYVINYSKLSSFNSEF